jgi:hypothetical protein
MQILFSELGVSQESRSVDSCEKKFGRRSMGEMVVVGRRR